jgi:hypothetical protein
MHAPFRGAATLVAASLALATGPMLARTAAQAGGQTTAAPSPPPPPSPAANTFLEAVRRGDAPAVEQAIAGGVDVDTPFRYGRTALSFAADRGYVEVVRVLLAKGAKVDLEDTFYHQTALGWASSPAQARTPGHAQVVKLLLEKGAKGVDRALAAAIDEGDLAMLEVVLADTRLPPSLLSESLAAAKKDNDKAPVVAALEKAGVAMPVVATLTPAQLARCPGTYKSDNGGALTVTLKDGVVSGVFGGPPTILSPRSETLFAAEGRPGTTATFAYDGETASTVTVVSPFGGTTLFKRVNQP